jgi:hypothetical protein
LGEQRTRDTDGWRTVFLGSLVVIGVLVAVVALRGRGQSALAAGGKSKVPDMEL